MQVKICRFDERRRVLFQCGDTKIWGIAMEPKDGFVVVTPVGDGRHNDPAFRLYLNEAIDLELNTSYEHQPELHAS